MMFSSSSGHRENPGIAFLLAIWCSPTAGCGDSKGGTSPMDGSMTGGDTSGVVLGTAVNLGGAGAFAILAKSGISTVPTSAHHRERQRQSDHCAQFITGFIPGR